MVFCILKFRGAHNKQHKKQHKFISCRRMKHFDEQKFYDEAASLPWWYIVRKHDNMNSAVNYFTEILVSLIEKHAPLRLKRVSQKHYPWLNADYNALRKARDRLKKAAIKQNSTYLMESYKHLRNKVNSLNKKLKREYFSNKLQENIGNLKETWKIVHSFVNKTSNTTKIDTIKVEDKIVTDKNEIPNIMNKYFCNVGESLKKKIPNKPNSLLNGIYNVNRDSKEFLFSEISEEEIISITSTFKTSKGSGPDSIPNFFIKIVISVIARPLATKQLITKHQNTYQFCLIEFLL